MRLRLRLVGCPLLSSPIVRAFHHSHPRPNEPPIFENSLEKTLEVHRSVNRQSLIRKIPFDSSSHSDRDDEPRRSAASQAQSTPDSQSSARKLIKEEASRKAKPRKRKLEVADLSSNSFYRPVDWSAKNDEPGQCPWLDKIDPGRTFATGLSQLDAEVRAVEEYLSTTIKENMVVCRVLSEIYSILRETIPHEGFEVIGSRRTKFAMGHSDLNISFVLPDPVWSIDRTRMPSASRPESLRKYRRTLQIFGDHLSRFPDYRYLRLSKLSGYETATFLHQPTGLQIQVSCSEGSTTYVEYIMDFQAEYPQLRPLYMVTRLMLESKGLFGSSAGSLDPLALQMLIVAFLKMTHGRFKRTGGCGEPLLKFLEFFGTDVDLSSAGIAVDPPGFFNADYLKQASRFPELDASAHIRGQRALINAKKSAAASGNEFLAKRLCLQDPTNYMSDLGGRCIRTPELGVAFADSYQRLTSALDAWEPSTQGRPVTSLLRSIVRADFGDFESRRASIVDADWTCPIQRRSSASGKTT
ncbi:hypothetical protein BJX61DRAFT_396669 [Aspergillus egyptiacus]|nr:hypothetical protein BJX61DRAFT_396669 [Aspergillus egyptiacus]